MTDIQPDPSTPEPGDDLDPTDLPAPEPDNEGDDEGEEHSQEDPGVDHSRADNA